MSLKVLDGFRGLQDYDFRLLGLVEKLGADFRFPPLDELKDAAKEFLSESHLERALVRLNKLGYLEFTDKIGYRAIVLQFPGYDALSLDVLAKTNILDSIGGVVGRGKESDVFLGLSSGSEVVLKIHRLGKGFKRTRRTRGYMGDKAVARIYESRLAATQEYKALRRVSMVPAMSVPIAVGHNRHIVVMSRVRGDDLIRVRDLSPTTAQDIVGDIKEQIHLMIDHHVIHGDLSPYNIMLSEDDLRVYIIDWPQFVAISHPGAKDILYRDLMNTFGFFEKRFRIKMPDLEEYTSRIPK